MGAIFGVNRRLTILRNDMRKTIASLFTGCGGLDLGFIGGFNVPSKCINKPMCEDWIEDRKGDEITLRNNPFDIVFANDIKTSCQITHNRYFIPRATVPANYAVGSIVDIVKQAQLNLGPLHKLSADIVTGGFPCQDFSLNGKRRGLSSHCDHRGAVDVTVPSIESRGMLYYWMMKAIDLIRPKCFIAENVKGLALMEDVVSIIRSDFASVGSHGYLVMPARVLFAPQYGIAQTRERIIFIGFNRKHLSKEATAEYDSNSLVHDPYPKITHRFIPSTPTQKSLYQDPMLAEPVTVRDVFVGLDEPNSSSDLSQRAYSKASYLPHSQGRHEVNLDGHGPTIRSEHHGNIEYRRLTTERGGKHLSELRAGLPERRMSVRECARIQSFPDSFEFVIPPDDDFVGVTMSEAYKIVGNAVPPLLGYHIAKRLDALWPWLFN